MQLNLNVLDVNGVRLVSALTIADRMSATVDIKTVLASDSVFENGFDPLGGGFDAGLPANQVFRQSPSYRRTRSSRQRTR